MEGSNECASDNRTDSGKKRTFDKKKWREQKYSKHQKIEQWQERRKKAALHKYRKVLRKEMKIADPSFSFNSGSWEDDRNKRKSRYQEALDEYERKKEEKEAQRKEALRLKAERQAAWERAQAERAERYKILNKKTRKGQPVMKGRIELMLQKIQNMQ
ncbi:hypothetical protein R5R35_012881 [Gryllus longicercus]|uniref:Thyroid transcription factor 1-associated protein 26 n=1 Tax=Gryllus longicercus TaxID=2509291 RepID=A0AAN9VSC4_9ORTH